MKWKIHEQHLVEREQVLVRTAPRLEVLAAVRDVGLADEVLDAGQGQRFGRIYLEEGKI